jgi:hypothetical protein
MLLAILLVRNHIASASPFLPIRSSATPWLEPGIFLDQTMEVIKYNDFVNRELILFSMADLSRSIPSVVDGLKPSQRKILFCAFKRNFVIQAKVA